MTAGRVSRLLENARNISPITWSIVPKGSRSDDGYTATHSTERGLMMLVESSEIRQQ